MSNTLFTHKALTGTKNFVLNQIIQPSQKYRGQERTSDEKSNAKLRRVENINECINEGYVDKLLIKNKDSSILLNQRIGCKSRFCPNCNEVRKKVYRHKLRNIVKNYQKPRFMTISFKNVTELTSEYLKECSKQFNMYNKYLKRETLTLGNYICVMEIKHNIKGAKIFDQRRNQYVGTYETSNWNVHYHIIYDGDFIPVVKARELLKKVTKKKSFYVDIQALFSSNDRIRNTGKALNYVTKYISKMTFRSESSKAVIDYYKATNRMRFVKVGGLKPPQKESQFELFKNYLNNLNYDYEQIEEMICDIQSFMNKNEMKEYDLTLCKEDNFFTYAPEKNQIDCIIGEQHD